MNKTEYSAGKFNFLVWNERQGKQISWFVQVNKGEPKIFGTRAKLRKYLFHALEVATSTIPKNTITLSYNGKLSNPIL